MWCWQSSPAQRTPSWTWALALVCLSPVMLAAQQMVCTGYTVLMVLFLVLFLDPTSFAFDGSDNIFTDLSTPSAGHWEQIIPEDKQWVNAGEFLGFSGTLVYRWGSDDTDMTHNLTSILLQVTTLPTKLCLTWMLPMPHPWEKDTILNTLAIDQHFTILAIPVPRSKLEWQ